MASTSSSTSAPNHYKYDVFLSFRGDTRFAFTDHLYEALIRAGIRTFRDDDEIERGQELKPEIERAIRESRASIIVLSQNYAKSRCCLDELWLILEERRKCNHHFVLPVFYHVDASDVRNQRRSFAIKVKDGVEGSKWTADNVNRWKSALTEVADLAGEVVSGYETDFIAKIVDNIYCELDLKLLSIRAHLTGIETRAEGINSWLKYEQPDCQVLAICGMGGSGKTTLAKYIYNSNKQNFESSSFLEEIGKHHRQLDGLLGLQKQLLRDVLGKNIVIPNVSEGTPKIEKAIQNKRVLIVLDDIDDREELITLLGTKEFHTQSKIIITTRLLDINSLFGSISRRCSVHKLQLLNDLESLELLSWHAFGSKFPMEGFKDLAVKLAHYCGGNPLALEVLGSSLFVRDEDPWTIKSMMEIWISRLNSLNSLKGDLDSKIQDLLEQSYKSLPCDNHKELFLHIACFFVGEQEYDVVRIFEHDLYAKSGIMTLINRCLLTVSPLPAKRLVMHQLLQDMGRKIVYKESKDPAKRSRVWHHDESYDLLRKGDGSDTIEGLALDMREVEQGMRLEASKTSLLAKMKNLILLAKSNNNFPRLRLLMWTECNLKTIPSGLLMSSFLVAIYMRFGDFEEFKPPTVLNSLKILDLRCCHKLFSICNLHRLPKLDTLDLEDCTNLTYLCKTIGDLQNLSALILSGCTKLWKASWNKKYVNQLERLKALFIGGGIPAEPLFSLPQSLKLLDLSNCDLEYTNDVPMVFNPLSIFHLKLGGNLFEFLPNNIDLKMLRALNLISCPYLKSLPCLPSTLEQLNIAWCTSLERITFQSARFSLHEFLYEGCLKLCEVQGLFKLVSIAKLDEAYLGHMRWIKAYENHKVDLDGDVITEGKTWDSQMLYEYGIRSTYLPGIKDQSMTTSKYTSSSHFLSFRVPLHPKKHRIRGLNVSCLYRSSGSEDKDRWVFFAEISNITKGLTWIYNPAVYCKPRVDEDVVWLSYWPIGNILDVGDEVNVQMLRDKGMIVSGCGASLEYMDDGEVEKEEGKCENTREEVIGGDLSEFQVNTGVYYLCRHDFFKSTTPDFIKTWLPNTVPPDTLSRGWRKYRRQPRLVWRDMTTFRNYNGQIGKLELGVSFNSESEIDKIEKAVSRLVGVESVSIHKDIGRLFVVGYVDPEALTACVRKFEKVVVIIKAYFLNSR